MMTPQDQEIFDELKARVKCVKNFVCVESALSALCAGKYYEDLDILECLQCAPNCGFVREFGSKRICTCPLRKFIAVNFERLSAESTGVLRGDDQPL